MESRADAIASKVIEQFNKLPSKRKPVVRDNGSREWVPLSGIVAEIDGDFICLALATGMKCLPASKLSTAKGIVIHDWHAEVLATRAFNRHVLDECHNVIQGASSRIVTRRQSSDSETSARGKPFEIIKGVKLHMYCSEAPCGDASMELIMAEQEDASPWEVPDSGKSEIANPHADASSSTLPGRAYFSQLGVVRRKPARRDAEPTLSKSCSDKISMKQSCSLLNALTSLHVDVSGAYISTLVVPRSRYTETGYDRAFSAQGRMAPVATLQWNGGYAFRPFSVATTSTEFAFSRKMALEKGDRITASNIAAVWTESGLEETIMGGIIQGRRLFDVKGASGVSRLHMWKRAKTLAESVASDSLSIHFGQSSYGDVKSGTAMAARRQVKNETRSRALAGWVIDDRDSGFGLI